jgi:hypothetical protein
MLKPGTREALEGSINYLDRLVIELTFALDVRVEACVINLGIFDAKKQQVAQCVSIKSNFIVSGSPDVQLLVVEISDQPLSLGTYSLSVYFVEKVENNRRGRIYFYRNQALTFKVFDESPGYSLVHLPAKWQLVSEANGAESINQ